jgi:hypothetical protein
MNEQNRTYESALTVFLYEAKNAGYDIDEIFEKVKTGIIGSPVRPGPNYQNDTLVALKNKIDEVKNYK